VRILLTDPGLITAKENVRFLATVAGVGLVYSLVVAPSDGLFSDVGIHAWFVPSAIVTLAFNLWCTCLIGAQARFVCRPFCCVSRSLTARSPLTGGITDG
jgi:hypothetical protein